MEANRHASSKALGARRPAARTSTTPAVLCPQRLRPRAAVKVSGCSPCRSARSQCAREAVGGGDVVDDVRARATARAIGLLGAFELPGRRARRAHRRPTTGRARRRRSACWSSGRRQGGQPPARPPPPRPGAASSDPAPRRGPGRPTGAPAVRVVDPVAPSPPSMSSRASHRPRRTGRARRRRPRCLVPARRRSRPRPRTLAARRRRPPRAARWTRRPPGCPSSAPSPSLPVMWAEPAGAGPVGPISLQRRASTPWSSMRSHPGPGVTAAAGSRSSISPGVPGGAVIVELGWPRRGRRRRSGRPSAGTRSGSDSPRRARWPRPRTRARRGAQRHDAAAASPASLTSAAASGPTPGRSCGTCSSAW